MILTIAGADFSGANIGQNKNNSVRISLTKGRGVDGTLSQIILEKGVISTDTQIATLSLKENYKNLTITVKMNNAEVSGWVKNGTVTIPANTNITGDIKISASATAVVPDEPETPGVPDEPETPGAGTTLTFVNGDAVVVDSVSDMQFTIGNSFTGDTPYTPITNTNGSKGRAASVGYVLKVNGGETITLNQCLSGKTVYYATIAFANNTDTKANQSDQVFTMKKWETASKVIPSEVKYLFIAFKNDGGTTDFTTDEIETIKNNFIIS